MTDQLIPAAQYLRMSTEHQQYSIANQAEAISRYAEIHGFSVVKTYSDPAKSGLSLKKRSGLRQLLKDAVEGRSEFRAILVYDVSRWGRFQDCDEAAHYEYLCKSSGVPVHYCAEMFPDDAGFAGAIMKALKRTMAGEYSRDLSARVRAGLTRLAKQGYKAGGSPPYGLRRQLLDSRGIPLRLLATGERKSLVTDKVILVPGPQDEVEVVRRIFREFAEQHRSMRSIAKRLNSEGIPFNCRNEWSAATISRVLKQPNYVGTQVWGRTTSRLCSPPKEVPPEQWAVCPNAFTAIVDETLFDHAQVRFRGMTHCLTDEELLHRARRVFEEHGTLTGRIIEQSRLCPGATTYWHRFHGLLSLYARLGINSKHGASILLRQRLLMIRRELMNNILQHFSAELEEFRPRPHFRALLRHRRTGLLISVLMGKCKPTTTGKIRWFIFPPKSERKRITILALLNKDNSSVQELHIFPDTKIIGNKAPLRENNPWLQSGIRAQKLSDLLDVIQQMRALKSPRTNAPESIVPLQISSFVTS
jgi:DNA invertase Pin-like site-specific DNA recombinase